jgi:hypothetical protein
LNSFCKTCGVPLGSTRRELSPEEYDGMSDNVKRWYDGAKTVQNINVRLLDGVRLQDLKIERFDGYNIIQPAYKNP